MTNFTGQQFSDAVLAYVKGAQDIINRQFSEHYPRNLVPILEYQTAKRYVKVYNTENGRRSSIFAFIDTTNGDILKPASYKAPAKHARGNVFDADNGLSRTQWTGPVYLRWAK